MEDDEEDPAEVLEALLEDIRLTFCSSSLTTTSPSSDTHPPTNSPNTSKSQVILDNYVDDVNRVASSWDYLFGDERRDAGGTNVTAPMSQDGARSTAGYYKYIEDVLYTRVAVAICVFGLIGNICNLFVLVPQGRHCSMGRIEKFAYWGLVSLSVSDACFCLLVIPHLFVERDSYSVNLPSFSLLYGTYGSALLNVFIMASTWMTVVIAVGRYLAICHPFKAREFIGGTVAKRAGLIVYCVCIAFNIPRFLTDRIQRIDCPTTESSPRDLKVYYFRWPGYAHVRTNPQFERGYNWLYFTFGICLPCAFLIVSSILLVRALGRARSKLLQIRVVEGHSVDAYRPITLTLVVLVLMHIILVSPAEFAMFVRQRLAVEAIHNNDEYNLLAAVGNSLQAINFSVNFVLYYVINAHFRRSVSALLRCRTAWPARSSTRSDRGQRTHTGYTGNGSTMSLHAFSDCSLSVRGRVGSRRGEKEDVGGRGGGELGGGGGGREGAIVSNETLSVPIHVYETCHM